jgi:hypothetical protein
MKVRLLSIVLASAMILGTLPVASAALAAPHKRCTVGYHYNGQADACVPQKKH